MEFKEHSRLEGLFFKAPKRYFRLVGMWPEDNIFEWKNLVVATFSFILLITTGLAQLAFAVSTIGDNIQDAFEVICSTAKVWVSLLKLFVLLCLRMRLKKIIMLLRNAWIDGNNSTYSNKVYVITILFF